MFLRAGALGRNILPLPSAPAGNSFPPWNSDTSVLRRTVPLGALAVTLNCTTCTTCCRRSSASSQRHPPFFLLRCKRLFSAIRSCNVREHRTFRHSVYPISPGLLHQTINYVTQVNCFFFFFFATNQGCVCMCVCACWSVGTVCLCRWVTCLCFHSVSSEFLNSNKHGQSQSATPPLHPSTPFTNSQDKSWHVLWWCDFVLSLQPPPPFFSWRGGGWCCSCVTLLMPRLCMWEMCQSPPKSCDWLAGHTPPTVQHPPPVASKKAGALRRLGKVSMATATSGVCSLM